MIFGLIIRLRKESIKKQTKNKKHENQFKFDGLEKYDDVIHENEENSYEIVNYELVDYNIGVYDEINYNELKIEANTSKTLEYLEIFE